MHTGQCASRGRRAQALSVRVPGRCAQGSWVREGWRPPRRRRNGHFPREQGWGGTRHRVGASSRGKSPSEPVLASGVPGRATCAARCPFCRAASTYFRLLPPTAQTAAPLLTCSVTSCCLFHAKTRVGVRELQNLVIVYTGERQHGVSLQVRWGVAV